MTTRQRVASNMSKLSKVRSDSHTPLERPSTNFGVATFSDAQMKRRVPHSLYEAVKEWRLGGPEISREQADILAEAMKNWALEEGVRAYSLWFQPISGMTAEKHQSFIQPHGDTHVLEVLSGEHLIMKSSSGSVASVGGRSTFEGRGYTAWDPTSPPFIRKTSKGKSLCIPGVFISYDGESLDKKQPLIRSESLVRRGWNSVESLFGDETTAADILIGVEQEFFLIDEGYYRLRPDIQISGRTLLGAPSPQGLHVDDQYFGGINDRILDFMYSIESSAHALGIPLGVWHNEIAPNQFEFSQLPEIGTRAVDHNQLLMDLLRKTAGEHGLYCLLHEMPFDGLNSSGKHVHWSLVRANGDNVLRPKGDSTSFKRFLLVIASLLKTVWKHGDLLVASSYSAGNELRFGFPEAPSTIMGVFLGDAVADIVERIAGGERVAPVEIECNCLDEHRTAPIALAGDTIELRLAGSSANISTMLTAFNTAMGDIMLDISNQIKSAIDSGVNEDESFYSILEEVFAKTSSVIFNGDHRSKDWVERASEINRFPIKATIDAFDGFRSEETVELFERTSVFTRGELERRYELWIELYNRVMGAEAATLAEVVQTLVLPTAYEYQVNVGNSLSVLRDMAEDESIPLPLHALDDRKAMFAKLSEDIYLIRKHLAKLHDMIKIISRKTEEEKADYYFNDLIGHANQIRRHVDHLEETIPDDLWVLPKYREMLFNI